MPKPPTNTQHTEVVADPENDRRRRRKIATEEKLRILKEADACRARGELSALLRREGIYSSQLNDWRKVLRAHGEAGLVAKTPGPKPAHDERDLRIDNWSGRRPSLSVSCSSRAS